MSGREVQEQSHIWNPDEEVPRDKKLERIAAVVWGAPGERFPTTPVPAISAPFIPPISPFESSAVLYRYRPFFPIPVGYLLYRAFPSPQPAHPLKDEIQNIFLLYRAFSSSSPMVEKEATRESLG